MFDITLETTEKTNLIEYANKKGKNGDYDYDFDADEFLNDIQETANLHLGGGSVTGVTGVTGISISDDESESDIAVGLLWEEGIKLIASYADNSVMFNTYRECQATSFDDDGLMVIQQALEMMMHLDHFIVGMNIVINLIHYVVMILILF